MGLRYINSLITPEKLNTFLELVDLAAGAGKDTNNVFDLSERLNNSRQMQLCTQTVLQNPASAAIVKERYMGQPYDLETMLNMPQYSLGWTYAKVLSALGYDPGFYRTPSSFNSDAEYITFRVYKTHDLHHILTGFSLDNLGELGVISVTAAQIAFPTFLFLDTTSLLLNFLTAEQLYREDLEPAQKGRTMRYSFELISKGIEMGQAAKPLFPIKWEEELERPLEEWREELNIKPVLDGLYSWYSNTQIRDAIA
ncbi:pyrroloquinoline quinone biosynthesis protein [Aphanothece hegewaldii CCALA 016]|uniref:Pyrroloquinoline quinone biosynthesis protein n=1 Tax=Aphanothece hegewaldii CCALA 016 TaxID=2107694 RepID=A0A2T1M1Z9_9CHRO|nr:Coq4 family protein [Aphanothece hegewaldii]PSF38744.1 pyrroloquinoline quinone biosynthesis protein [Aphanothece hegewaldii CCALA 016]